MLWQQLRVGNILRIFFGMLCLSWVLIGVARGPLWMYAGSVLASWVAASVTALWIARTFGSSVRVWRRAVIAARREDFSVPMPSSVPPILQPINHLLESARESLAASLEEARREKALLNSILNAMNEGVVSVNADGEIGIVNRFALHLFGFPATQDQAAFEGKTLVQLARDPRLNELVDLVLRDGQPVTGETEILATRKTVTLSIAPIHGGSHVKGAVIAIKDETNVRKLERVRQDFVTNVSHELKTPIAAIRGWSETLVGGMIEVPEELFDPLQTIYRQSLRLSDLVDDLLTLARAEAGAELAGYEPVYLDETVEAVAIALDEVIVTKGITFAVELSEDAQEVTTSRKALEYILRNLIENALKFTRSGGRVTVRSTRESGFIALEVEDTGPGIERHHLPRIFERFYRVDEGRHRDVGGTGLGLSIVKHYTTSLGGRVSVSSEVGRGSIFRVELPSDAATGESVAEPSSAE